MNSSRKSVGIAFAAVCFALAVSANSWAQKNTDAKQFLATHEPQLSQATEVPKRLGLLENLAAAALAANDKEKARSYAEDLLALGKANQSQLRWGSEVYGRATHVGNVVLGRIALMNGNLNQAGEYLLAAGRIPGSAALNSFGPDMLLAKELIEEGTRDPVIAYFDLCSKFWIDDRGRLQQWKDIVAHGGTPNFGANLDYVFYRWRFAK